MDIDLDLWEALRSNQTSMSGVNLHAELYKAWEEFDEAEVELRKLRRRISALEEKRDFTQSRCTNIISLLAPIRRLPPEIISKIFAHTLGPGLVDPLKHPLPVLLTHVCSYWRHIALSTPTLWSSLSVEPRYDHNSAQTKQILDEFLARSGTAPLSIFIHLRHFEGGDPLGTLVEHAHRWKSLSIFLDGSHLRLDPLRIEDVRLAQLEQVHLEKYREYQSDPPFLQEITVFQTAPNLTSVTLAELWRPNISPLPWSQLTHLALGDADSFTVLSIADLFDILPRCSQLTHFTFASLCGDNDEPGRHPGMPNLIELPKLRSLILRRTRGVGYFLRQLRVPDLNKFIYQAPFGSSTPRCDLAFTTLGLQSCLQKSRCVITTLEFTPVSATLDDVLRFLYSLPSIRNVHLHLGAQSSEHDLHIIRYLSGPDSIPSDRTSGSQKPLMLESITITDLHDSLPIVEALVSMIRFRCGLPSESSDSFVGATPPTTRLVFASFDKRLSTTLVPRLEVCVATGLRLDFH